MTRVTASKRCRKRNSNLFRKVFARDGNGPHSLSIMSTLSIDQKCSQNKFNLTHDGFPKWSTKSRLEGALMGAEGRIYVQFAFDES